MRSLSEQDMLDALHRRYSQKSQANTIRYAVAEHVRNDAGFDATNTADFVAMDLWPRYGAGLELHGHEVKCSRKDWLTELKQPWKAAAFTPFMNRWWIVAADDSIVKLSELQEGWGLLVWRSSRLRALRSAERSSAQPMPKGMMAALLRACQVTATRRIERDLERREAMLRMALEGAEA